MRSILLACAATLLMASQAQAQIELLNIPPDRLPPQRGDAARQPPGEQLFIAPSGEPFRGAPEQPYPVAVWFARADVDHDRRLTFAEFVADSLTFFDRLDASKDGVVDGFEAQAYERTIVPELGPSGRTSACAPAPRRARGLFGRRGPQPVEAEGAALYGLLNEPQPVAGADSDLDRKISRAEATAAAQRRFAGWITTTTACWVFRPCRPPTPRPQRERLTPPPGASHRLA